MLMKEDKSIGRTNKMLENKTKKSEERWTPNQHILRTAEIMRSFSRSYMNKFM